MFGFVGEFFDWAFEHGPVTFVVVCLSAFVITMVIFAWCLLQMIEMFGIAGLVFSFLSPLLIYILKFIKERNK